MEKLLGRVNFLILENSPVLNPNKAFLENSSL